MVDFFPVADKPLLHPAALPVGYALLILSRAHAEGKNPQFTWLFVLITASTSFYQIFFRVHDASSGTSFGGTICSLGIYALDIILLKNWQPAPRKIGQKEPTSSLSFWERIKWSTSLVFSVRQIGFTTQCAPPHIRLTPPSVTRSQFIISGLSWMCFYYILYDACCLASHAIPMFGEGGPSFSDYPWYWRGAVWFQIFGVSGMMSMVYTVPSLVAVALGINKPQAWPPYFGSLKEAYTVRNVWGRVWHQLLRKFVSSHGTAAADVLRLPKGTFRTYFQIYVAFFMSGVIHWAGDYMYLQNLEGVSIEFFVLQAVAITVEDVFMGIARRVGFTKSTSLTRFIGFCWVFVWFAASLPYWLEPVWHRGAFNATSPDNSLVQYLWKGQWKVSKGVFV